MFTDVTFSYIYVLKKVDKYNISLSNMCSSSVKMMPYYSINVNLNSLITFSIITFPYTLEILTG